MAIDKKLLDRFITDKQYKLNKKIEQYKSYLNSQNNWIKDSMDIVNTGSTSYNYIMDIAKLEGELQLLEELLLYL